MASKKSYSRYFIILQEDEKGFGLSSGKTPTGYAKIEIKNLKCKISYYVQNLKPDDKYSMLLICGKKGCRSLINIGNINLDEQGRADVSYEYDEENIGGSNTSVDKVIGASIARIMDSNVISLMSGFITTDMPKDWRSYSIININDHRESDNIFENYEEEIEKNKQVVENNSKEFKIIGESDRDKKDIPVNKVAEESDKDKKDIPVNKVAEESDRDKKDIPVNKVAEESDRDKKDIPVNKVAEESDRDKKDISVNKVAGKLEEKQEFEEIMIRDKNKEDQIKDEIETSKNNKEEVENYKEKIEGNKEDRNAMNKKDKCNMDSMEKFFESLGEGMEKYSDMFPKIQKSVWYKVDVEDVNNMCDMSDYQKYVVMHYPMINYYPYIKEYKHYLVGYKYDENCKIKYIMYAIPGSKSPNCQPFKGKTGFVTWMKSYNLDKNQGYWIMFYDFKNYNILIPIKKNK